MTRTNRQLPMLAVAAVLMFGAVLASCAIAGQHGTAAGNTSLVTTSSAGGAGQTAPSNLRMDVINNLRMD